MLKDKHCNINNLECILKHKILKNKEFNENENDFFVHDVTCVIAIMFVTT